jgi:hypothetical protein
MKDPALGRTREERALGEFSNKKSKKKATRTTDFRMAHTGQYDGPKGSYGRYNVGQNAADLLNRSKRNMDMR